MQKSQIGLRLASIVLAALLISQMSQAAWAVQRRPGGGGGQGATCGCLCNGKTGWCKATTRTDGKCRCTKDSVYPCSGTCTQEKARK